MYPKRIHVVGCKVATPYHIIVFDVKPIIINDRDFPGRLEKQLLVSFDDVVECITLYRGFVCTLDHVDQFFSRNALGC